MRYRNINKRDPEIILLRGIMAEIYYLLKDRRSKGIDNVMLRIEKVFPDIKDYKSSFAPLDGNDTTNGLV